MSMKLSSAKAQEKFWDVLNLKVTSKDKFTPSVVIEKPLIQQKVEPENYVETKIATKYGEFNFRVYAAIHGKETVVLWTDNLNTAAPVLVRVHSECLTGDLFDSFRCDCGPQLHKSLQMINKEGGVLIYLRQEGRGIGLLEKIKTYQLQSKGYDTFEANVALGHRPDERSYEMVKTVLSDLKIQSIRLITNNPSKISEVAKLGINVVERVPVVIKPNKHNRKYFKTKCDKFRHCFDGKNDIYFYQFHAETQDHVKEIAEFVKDKKRDPLLKIFVGITADHSTLLNESEITRIESICNACNLYEDFIPVLHFSFRHSPNVIEAINLINERMSFIVRLQMNDLPSLKMKYFELAGSYFSLDIPICDENFDSIHNKRFRNFIRKSNAFLLLDNSKGRGIQEPKDSLSKKIDTILGYSLKNIAIFGGFGPNELDTYFELRRYYRINFSIDAETKLKTNGQVDIEKTRVYLSQLIRFDDPKQSSIDQTKSFLNQHRRSDWDKVTIENKEFLIHPNVFHAGVFPSTSWFAEKVSKIVKGTTHFCEVGCGSGVISCFVGMSNPKIRVIATDINPFASENTKLNAERMKLQKRLEVKKGDVLDSIPEGSLFDTIFWALPFGFLDPGTEMDLEDMQVFDPGYRAIRKFFQTARKFLKPNGRLLIGFSSDLGHYDLLEEIAKEFNLKLSKIDERAMTEVDQVKFEILEGIYY
ncbi:MAG: GTP cyclohydrolase II [Chlamydiae bacterium]|nr:GTP cyclohydrolase II [Chlamydiota bacterium]